MVTAQASNKAASLLVFIVFPSWMACARYIIKDPILPGGAHKAKAIFDLSAAKHHGRQPAGVLCGQDAVIGVTNGPDRAMRLDARERLGYRSDATSQRSRD
jgi:hypothetical protein